jgi:NAD(P)-dependent dehydrogenase (short-subunit alcohol dehydrogenase family)
MSQAVIPSMKENGGGSIVCLSSVSAQRGGGIFGGPHGFVAQRFHNYMILEVLIIF